MNAHDRAVELDWLWRSFIVGAMKRVLGVAAVALGGTFAASSVYLSNELDVPIIHVPELLLRSSRTFWAVRRRKHCFVAFCLGGALNGGDDDGLIDTHTLY